MRLLLDSHALVWYILGDTKLPGRVRDIVDLEETEVFVSAVCIWEIAIKVRKGSWPEAAHIPSAIEEITTTQAFIPLPITIQHARIAAFLPGRHRDPFDRMLAAQAQVEGVMLATADRAFQEFGVNVIW